ncbi:MAG: 4-hydroxybenzoyl-CoA reductase, partial [Syntrophaceae bacterium]
MKGYRVINTRVPRVDGRAKATGKARYADDLSMPGMLYGALLQSPVAHAGIRRIDTSKAKKLPGVKDVVTAQEAGAVKFGVSPARYDETIFCIDKARYVGDEIAAVAAVDLETALEAAALIEV